MSFLARLETCSVLILVIIILFRIIIDFFPAI